MDEEELKCYVKAGEIAARVREYATRIVRPGMKIIELVENVENKIRELGGQPAFPCNVSINYEAAHRTALINDELSIPDDSVVKIDVGVHINGYIADTAVTVSFNPKYEDLLNAVELALSKALNVVGNGVRFIEIGKIVEETLKSHGFKPIKNLSGHSLDRFIIHAGESIPNHKDILSMKKFKAGKAYAIEPFGTDGKGYVEEHNLITIYALWKTGRIKGLSANEKKLLDAIRSRFKTLPFSERWLMDVFNNDIALLRNTLERLWKRRIIWGYPILVEAGRGMVAQFEHTVVVLEKEVIVTTKLK
ncbi:MAG: type II methionyl aminopeptidase [Thermoproteota archaeon]|nr:MAG: type II methionyl aminopeptidase [Candidatus Korarchaeota archaeon]